MLISVIIPAYRCADTIENTVNSILVSGLSDFEIIIIDDGSQDGTAERCDSLAEKHPCVRCIHQKNAGVSAARNRGLKEARGEYVWFFDADDSADENALSDAESILIKASPDMLVFGMSFDHYSKGKRYRRDELLPPLEGPAHTGELSTELFMLYQKNVLSSLCNRIIKRNILVQMHQWLREDMFLYEDLEFTLRIWKHCENVYFLREPIYRYRQAEDGGNAGRRLMRIPHIPALLDQIEAALDGVAVKNRILLSLCLTLAREKISAASVADIKTVCADYRNWIDAHDLLSEIQNREYAMLIYDARIISLAVKRNISKIRHRAANWVKRNIGDFRKWTFGSGKEGKQ